MCSLVLPLVASRQLEDIKVMLAYGLKVNKEHGWFRDKWRTGRVRLQIK